MNFQFFFICKKTKFITVKNLKRKQVQKVVKKIEIFDSLKFCLFTNKK